MRIFVQRRRHDDTIRDEAVGSHPSRDDETSTAAPSTTEPPVATVGTLPRELDATFAVLLDTRDVPRGDQAGFWYLTLSPSNGYAFGRVPSDPSQNTGVLTVSDGMVTFSAERGEEACSGEGTYRWTASGDTVSFAVVRDPCTVRTKQTTARPYRRCSGRPDTCVRPS